MEEFRIDELKVEEQSLCQFSQLSLLKFTTVRDAEADKAIFKQELDAGLVNLPDISAVGDEGGDIQTNKEAFLTRILQP